nr:DNA-directed DNA polymerase [Tanacetum cinerariifolium]
GLVRPSIPCEFPGMDECLALADLDFEPDPRVLLILGRCFLKTSRALIYMHKANAFLGLKDDPDSPKINPFYYDPEGDILLLEAILNSEPLHPLPNHEQYMPSYKKELEVCEAKTVKSSVDEPPEVELKDLPHHLEYTFLEGDKKLPVIIAKELGDEEKSALIKVLKSHKRAIARKLSDIQGINPEFCTHKILMEEDYKPAVQHQKWVNPKIHGVIKKEVEILLDAGLIYPISDNVKVKVGMFHFLADFVVVDFEPDPRVPLILRRCFLKIGRALIDVHKGKLTLRIVNEAITYNLDQTVRYSANYNQTTANKIDVICEEYSQEVIGFSDATASGNPTPHDDPIVSTTSSTLTSFEDIDFLLFEEADAFLGLEDDPDSAKINPFYYDPEGDILLLEAILNSEPLPPSPNMNNICLHTRRNSRSGDNKLPVIIAKELGDEEKSALIKVLKSHKRAIAWKLSDIQGINPEFCSHKILMKEDYKPAVQHQRRVSPKIYDVIKKEVEKLLDAGLIYPISDSSWVSPVHCVPKKGGLTVVENEENELILTHLVTEWRTVSLGIFKFPLTLVIKKRQRSPAHMVRFPTVACLLAYAMVRALFKGVC